jgi:uncharacterized protein YmfQ (DUF2313 family)
MYNSSGKIKRLTQQLYPTGRAFKMPLNGVFDKNVDALNSSEVTAFDDAMSTFDSLFPDNSNFTADDAERWEERLGMIVNNSIGITERKIAIIRKMNHPGTIPARQNFGYLQDQLQAAGFNVYVYENIFAGPVTMSPTDILGSTLVGLWDFGDSEFGEVEFGDSQTGSVFQDCVANYIDSNLDEWFDTGDNLRNTFFIAGEYIDTFASVDLARKYEFRQLILKIKPVQTVGFLFVNFV